MKLRAVRSSTLRRVIYAALMVFVLAVIAGCGSSDDSSSTSGGGSTSADTSGGGGGDSSAAKAEAQKIVDQFKAVPKWDGPTTPVKGLDAQKGKLVVCVSSNFAVPFLKSMCDNSVKAAKEAGFDTLSLDGKGDPSNYNQGIQQAISQKAVGIILIAIPADVVGPALKDAAAAGTKVVIAANDPIDYQPPPEIGANVTVDYTKVGELQSDYAIANTDGDVHAYGFYGGAFPSDVAQAKGQKAELERLCPSCTLGQESVLISNFPKTVPPIVQSQIRKNPDLNWFLPTFDALNLYVVPAVAAAGAKGKVRSSSHNAVEGNLKFILDDNVQVMSVGENTEWWAWGATDALIRLIVDQPVEPENIPIRIFDKEVIEEIGPDNLGDQDALFGNVDYRGEYRKLWGLE